MPFRHWVLACLGTTVGALAVCTGAAAQNVRVGIVNSSTDVPFFIADAKGYFKDEGLSVDLLPFDAGAKMIAFLGTGDLDVGGGAPSVALYNAAAQGVQIRIVADKAHHAAGLGHAALMVRKDLIEAAGSPISRISEVSKWRWSASAPETNRSSTRRSSAAV
jgi:NitT/TauT family transport system substrate-binding protein